MGREWNCGRADVPKKKNFKKKICTTTWPWEPNQRPISEECEYTTIKVRKQIRLLLQANIYAQNKYSITTLHESPYVKIKELYYTLLLLDKKKTTKLIIKQHVRWWVFFFSPPSPMLSIYCTMIIAQH